jgi:two-component sensor histidine kinase
VPAAFVALAGSVRPAQLIIWCVYSYLIAFATSLSASKEPRTLAAQRPASSQESRYLCVLSSPAADVGRIEGLRSQVFGKRQGEYKVEYRIVLPDRGVRWIESRRFISYNSDGQPQRVVGVNIDVTKRKRVEEQQRVLHAELDHRVKNALVTVSAAT